MCYLLISLFVFAILQTTTSEECRKFEGEINEGNIELNTTVICSCYKPEPGGPEAPAIAASVAAEEKTCDVAFSKKVDGIVTISLAELCGKCKSAPIKPVDPSEDGIPPLVVTSTDKPSEISSVPSSSSTDNVTESAPVKLVDPLEGKTPPLVVTSTDKPLENSSVATSSTTDNATERTTKEAESHGEVVASEVSSSTESSTSTSISKSTVKPLESGTVASPTVSDESFNGTTEKTGDPDDELSLEISSSVASKTERTPDTSSPADKAAESDYLNREKSGKGFSGGSVFLFFLCGAIVGVLLVLAVKYVRNRYKSRSYETNDAPQP